ncbi:hypothetical protein Tco_1177844, partial [Tanacetum coccineum]
HIIRAPTHVDKFARGDARWQEVTGVVGSKESRSRDVIEICRGVAFTVNERDSAMWVVLQQMVVREAIMMSVTGDEHAGFEPGGSGLHRRGQVRSPSFSTRNLWDAQRPEVLLPMGFPEGVGVIA